MKKPIIKFLCYAGILFISYQWGWKSALTAAVVSCAMYYVGMLEVEEKMLKLEALYKDWIKYLEGKLMKK